MNGIVIPIDPEIFSIGAFVLRWYSLLITLAIVAGVWLGYREAVRKGLDGLRVQNLAVWAVVSGIAGARLFHVIDNWQFYAANPGAILSIWNGGLAVYGGLIGGAIGGAIYAARHGIPGWKMADAAAPGMILGQALGRLACIPNGDAVGAPANVPWAFVYTNPKALVPSGYLGVPLHPYPLYELLFDLAILAVIWRLRSVFKRDGLLFLTSAALYSVGRFLLTFYRVEKVWFWGLQEAQVVALVVFAAAVAVLVWRLLTAQPPAMPAEALMSDASSPAVPIARGRRARPSKRLHAGAIK